ncbi:hypothetical protein, partial [Salmonella enterica]|uniref:hypothetical protein n=1 Tax=Salmonella enterica TaxID=28901 RepID=UPI00398C6DB9
MYCSRRHRPGNIDAGEITGAQIIWPHCILIFLRVWIIPRLYAPRLSPVLYSLLVFHGAESPSSLGRVFNHIGLPSRKQSSMLGSGVARLGP